VLGNQKLKRECTKDALGLFHLIDPTDPSLQACEPKMGRETFEFPNAMPDNSIKQNFLLGELISSGSFSTTRRGKMDPSIAVKCVLYSRLQEAGMINMFDTEVKMARELVHSHICSIRSVVRDEIQVCLVMDVVEGGDLFDKINASHRMSQDEATKFVWHMLSGIAYCHQLNICHRDIRPESYLLTSREQDAELKLCDFSLARMNAEGEYMKTMIGCLPYVAPEVIKGKYDKKCDVWSIGVVAFLCHTKRLPIYSDESVDMLAKRIVLGDVLREFVKLP